MGAFTTHGARNRDRSGRYQPGGVRLDLFDADAKAGIGAKTVGSRQSSVEHSHYSGDLCTDRAQGSQHFNISLDVFRIVGGMIIAYMGFDMLSGRHTVGQAPPPDDDVEAQSSLAPLIMFAAGPGTITAVVTLAAVHTPDSFPVTAIAAAVIGAGVTFIALLLAIQLGSDLGRSTQAMVTRFMGLIVASMGMQFVLAGLQAFLRT
jgi:putative Mn2+ efflux pump MntP